MGIEGRVERISGERNGKKGKYKLTEEGKRDGEIQMIIDEETREQMR